MNTGAEAVVKRLKEQELTLATAESCTGGLIAKLLTDVPGASAVYKGGVVSYVNEIKHRLLGVEQSVPIRRATATISSLSMPMSGWKIGIWTTAPVTAMASMVWDAT